ncbi:uncharacterized protein DSM5745_01140 [Aspergillus mulundensis]|uniref:Uncharacterized protein n=1 Tax=Aspergillus mulundensis TaxID=1810919 RepID=A0A3D8T729_9EURO|nr:hypothetical protein DSM5745_01140 [Aspergillus mulundensis]RDW93818.1 hypothetical protein DSM5745_01140 [Aspergillus mulundensis]
MKGGEYEWCHIKFMEVERRPQKINGILYCRICVDYYYHHGEFWERNRDQSEIWPRRYAGIPTATSLFSGTARPLCQASQLMASFYALGDAMHGTLSRSLGQAQQRWSTLTSTATAIATGVKSGSLTPHQTKSFCGGSSGWAHSASTATNSTATRKMPPRNTTMLTTYVAAMAALPRIWQGAYLTEVVAVSIVSNTQNITQAGSTISSTTGQSLALARRRDARR